MPSLSAPRLSVLLVLFLPAVAALAGKVVDPGGVVRPEPWTREERAAPIARRDLGRTPEASFALLRLTASESPHVHDRHDLTVTVLSGRSRIHFADRAVDLSPGDVVHVPRGAVHWAEVLGRRAVEVHVTFTPPFDGTDNRPVPAPKRVSGTLSRNGS
jgi:quercetin dioxygenase-like cupin family protein